MQINIRISSQKSLMGWKMNSKMEKLMLITRNDFSITHQRSQYSESLHETSHEL